jgi:hypothetical protein
MASKKTGGASTRKPPEAAESHKVIDEWMQSSVMPGIKPIVEYLDRQVRKAIPGLQYAVKWKQAYYGLPDRGWIIEIAAYDVSVNLVFLAGAKFDAPPPEGHGEGRYVKFRSLEEAKAPEVEAWIREAAAHPGWT